MTAPIDDDEELGIRMDQYDKEDDAELYADSINMNEYSKSKEAEEATWLDVGKDILMQPALGFAQAFTWPADVIKLAMVGEGLEGIDELEEAYRRAGKEFDRNEYLKEVGNAADLIPTQEMLEKAITWGTGVDTKPRSKTGKRIRQFFTIGGLARGKGASNVSNFLKGAHAGGTAVGITAGAEALGVPEKVAEPVGDLAGGGAANILQKEVRTLSKEASEIDKVAKKHNLPLYEFQVDPGKNWATPKISAKRAQNLENQLGESADNALNKVIQDNNQLAKLEKQGVDLEAFESFAWKKTEEAAAKDTSKWTTQEMVNDIDREIARKKSLAPSLSNGDKQYIKILEAEKKALTEAPKAKGAARTPKETNAEQSINLHRNYNKNLKGIYKKNEFSGVEEDVNAAYQFLNQSNRNVMRKNASPGLAEMFETTNKITQQSKNLQQTKELLASTYENGAINPKKLNKLLTSKKGQKLRRTIGEDGVKDLREIADYTEKAQASVKQFASSPKFAHQVAEWGTLAPILLVAEKSMAGAIAIGRPLAQYAKGYMMTKPAAREVYKTILKNAAKGSFKTMKADFQKLEDIITADYGSMEDFMQAGQEDMRIWNEDDD